jgi:hypothetical protein
MFRRRWLLYLVLAAMPLAGCTKGDECDRCETDEDCRDGNFCVNFNNPDGSFNSKRCGSGLGADQCRVR